MTELEKEVYLTRINGLRTLIGNTPLLAVHFQYKGENRVIYAKYEAFNMTGSIKDRMAYHIILESYKSGDLKSGDTIVEVTSGNTGIAFCAIGRALGHPVIIFMPDWMSKERINIMKSLGATVRLVSKEEGGFIGALKLSEELAAKTPNTFLPRQFENKYNVEAHYQNTGPEIWFQMQHYGHKIDAFVAGVGTGGTVMGIGNFLREKDKDVKIYPLEPANSPTMSTGHKTGVHRVQGISDEFIPAIIKDDINKLSGIIAVDDGDSIVMAQKLASMGIAVGISSGANFLGALMVQNQLGRDSKVVTIFSDDNKKYLSSDLLKEETVKDGFLSTDIDLTYFRAYKRVCQTCCDPLECVTADVELEIPYCPKE